MNNNKIISFYKKLILIFTLFITIFSIPVYSSQETPSVYAPSCILIEASTGKILFAKNANSKMYPASTTKVMTAILALENCNLTDVAVVSHDAIFNVPTGYANANLQEGEELTIEQLLYVLLIPSANDAAFVLAEHIAGSVESFSDMMNDKAIEIGCKNTHFVNPNGIHDENHYSTAYDLALMGQYAMKNEVFRKIVSTTIYTLPTTNKYDKTDRIFGTTNDLIKTSSKYYYKYTTGAKTGYTDAAGNCIIATAKKDDVELIAVILHDDKTEDGTSTRAIDCKTLFEYGFNNFSFKTIAFANSTQKTITVSGGSRDTKNLDLTIDTDINAYIPYYYDINNIETNIILNENIQAPLSQGDVVGKITFIVDETNYETNLIASHDVKSFNLFGTIFKIILIILILIILSKIFKHKNTSSRKKRSKKKKSSNRKNANTYNIDFYPRYKNRK